MPQRSFEQMMGVYPPGTAVILDSGKEGIVIHSQPDARLRPFIAIHRNGAQSELETLIFTDLHLESPSPRRVMDAATPDGSPIDRLRCVSAISWLADNASNQALPPPSNELSMQTSPLSIIASRSTFICCTKAWPSSNSRPSFASMQTQPSRPMALAR